MERGKTGFLSSIILGVDIGAQSLSLGCQAGVGYSINDKQVKLGYIVRGTRDCVGLILGH